MFDVGLSGSFRMVWLAEGWTLVDSGISCDTGRQFPSMTPLQAILLLERRISERP
jgi:hypothetical protein